jgi:hypothetical protein
VIFGAVCDERRLAKGAEKAGHGQEPAVHGLRAEDKADRWMPRTSS